MQMVGLIRELVLEDLPVGIHLLGVVGLAGLVDSEVHKVQEVFKI